jgi:hypothetical protein
MQTAPPLQGLYLLDANPVFRPLRGLRPGLCYVALAALVFLSACVVGIHVWLVGRRVAFRQAGIPARRNIELPIILPLDV